MTTTRRPTTTFEARAARGVRGLGLVLAVLALWATPAAMATPRDATLEQLRAIESAWAGADVSVSVEGGANGVLRIGDELVYRFRAERPGYLTAIHVDTHGSTTLLYPRTSTEEGRIGDGRDVSLPNASDGFTLRVEPPVGRDQVYAIVTDAPLSRRDLGLDSRDIVVTFEAEEASAFVRRVREALSARADDAVRVAHVEQQIDGRGEVQYRSADIIEVFSHRTRSVASPKLDLHIHFETDSAALDDGARRNIDEFARALEDPRLDGIRFKVAGHTDDRGSVEHNLELSRRRAERVRAYLVEQGVDQSRLEIEAHGENAPLMNEASDYARQMNRRVEFSTAR